MSTFSNPENTLLHFSGPPVTLEDWTVLRTLSQDELNTLGFGNFDDTLVLIPGAWHAKLPAGLELETISGKKVVVGTDEIDDDTRFGFLAYGFRVATSTP